MGEAVDVTGRRWLVALAGRDGGHWYVIEVSKLSEQRGFAVAEKQAGAAMQEGSK